MMKDNGKLLYLRLFVIFLLVTVFVYWISEKVWYTTRHTVQTVQEAVSTAEPTPEPEPVMLSEHAELKETLLDLSLCETGKNELLLNTEIEGPQEKKLRREVLQLETQDCNVSFILLDLRSGESVAYNTKHIYYPASTIKGLFAASLVDERPELLKPRWTEFEWLLKESSNEAYQDLADTYGTECLLHWCKAAGVREEIADNMYIDYSAVEAARLWAVNYYWFRDNESGKEMAELYEEPSVSLLHEYADEKWTTRSKAGWMSDYGDMKTTADCGIVYEGEYPYLLIIMTDLPYEFEKLENLTKILMDVHTDMIGRIDGTLQKD